MGPVTRVLRSNPIKRKVAGPEKKLPDQKNTEHQKIIKSVRIFIDVRILRDPHLSQTLSIMFQLSILKGLMPRVAQKRSRATQEPPKKHPKSSKGPCKKLTKKIPKNDSVVKIALSRRSHFKRFLGTRFGDCFCLFLCSLLI